AAFVLLDLLKRKAEGVGERFLVHPQQKPAHPNSTANMHVDRIWHASTAPIFRRRPWLVELLRRPLQDRFPLPSRPAKLQRVRQERKRDSTNAGIGRDRINLRSSNGASMVNSETGTRRQSSLRAASS